MQDSIRKGEHGDRERGYQRPLQAQAPGNTSLVSRLSFPKYFKNMLPNILYSRLEPENIKWSIKGQAFFPPCTHFPLSMPDRRHTERLRTRENLLMGRRGWGRSHIIQRLYILVLYISFNNLWLEPFPIVMRVIIACTVEGRGWAVYRYQSGMQGQS